MGFVTIFIYSLPLMLPPKKLPREITFYPAAPAGGGEASFERAQGQGFARAVLDSAPAGAADTCAAGHIAAHNGSSDIRQCALRLRSLVAIRMTVA